MPVRVQLLEQLLLELEMELEMEMELVLTAIRQTPAPQTRKGESLVSRTRLRRSCIYTSSFLPASFLCALFN